MLLPVLASILLAQTQGHPKVELIAISNDHDKVSWDASGKQTKKLAYSVTEARLAHAISANSSVKRTPSPPNTISFHFRLNTTKTILDPGFACRDADGLEPIAVSGGPDESGKGASGSITFHIPPAKHTINLTVGLAEGKWKTKYSVKRDSKFWNKHGLHVDVLAGAESDNWCKIRVAPIPSRSIECRMNAFDKNGNELSAAGLTTYPAQNYRDYVFVGKPDKVASISLQERPYHWTKFTNLPTIPKR